MGRILLPGMPHDSFSPYGILDGTVQVGIFLAGLTGTSLCLYPGFVSGSLGNLYRVAGLRYSAYCFSFLTLVSKYVSSFILFSDLGYIHCFLHLSTVCWCCLPGVVAMLKEHCAYHRLKSERVIERC